MLGLNDLCSRMQNDSQKITIFMVYLSLLLDNVLLTMIVPIMPDLLINNAQRNEFQLSEKSNNQEYQKSYRDGVLEISEQGNRSELSFEEPFLEIPFDPSTQSGRISILLSSKALVQLFLNPVIGIVTNRIGYPLPLFLGTCILLVSATVFAFGEGYVAFFLARSFQGIASSCIGITGMCLVAEKYPNEPDRSKMMGFVLGGIAVGVLIGYPFGGFAYDSLGKAAPFLLVVAFACLDGGLQLYHLDLRPSKEKTFPKVGWLQLFVDRRILLTGGAIGISTSTIAILEPCLPIWLLQEIKPKKWQLGTAFIPDSLGYFIGTNSVALIAYQNKRSKIAMPAMILVGISASLVPAATSMLQLVVPHFFLGFGIGAVDSALVPLLAALVDTKRSTRYGTVYAMQQMSVSLAYSLGPVFGSGLAKTVGFPWMMRIVGIINILYCPLLMMLERFIDEKNCKQLHQTFRQLFVNTTIRGFTDGDACETSKVRSSYLSTFSSVRFFTEDTAAAVKAVTKRLVKMYTVFLREVITRKDYSEAEGEIVDYHRRGRINYQEFSNSDSSD